ncbi:MAG: hypothetical protein GC129_00640 [Proteobacteria bacterium]|nr:hypothetical protein [Pseudomonadota bacterium]
MMQQQENSMSKSSQTQTAPAAEAQAEGMLTFTTRFGQVQVNPERLITFPHGLFGFRDCTEFGLAKLPNVENTPLLLLQCTNQPAIAFLVADPATLGLELKPEDRAEALRETKLPEASTQMMCIITLYDNGDSYYLTANLKAPVLIDSAAQTGSQFILSNKSYSTQHKI